MVNRTRKRRVASSARGFTLMEMIVAITLFTVIVSSATGIFFMASRAQRKLVDFEKMQAAARYTLEAIVREVRMGRVDYGYYESRSEPLSLPDRELALIDTDRIQLRFFKSDVSNEALCPNADSRPCLLVQVGSSEPSPVSPRGVRVRSAFFYVSPDVDPNAYDATSGDYLSDQQPAVTMLLGFENTAQLAVEQTYVQLQTTATSRIYSR